MPNSETGKGSGRTGATLRIVVPLSTPWVYLLLPHPGYTSFFHTLGIYTVINTLGIYTVINTLGIPFFTTLGIPPSSPPWVYHCYQHPGYITVINTLGIPLFSSHPGYTSLLFPPWVYTTILPPWVHTTVLPPWVYLLPHPGYTSFHTLGIPLLTTRFTVGHASRTLLTTRFTVGYASQPERRKEEYARFTLRNREEEGGICPFYTRNRENNGQYARFTPRNRENKEGLSPFYTPKQGE